MGIVAAIVLGPDEVLRCILSKHRLDNCQQFATWRGKRLCPASRRAAMRLLVVPLSCHLAVAPMSIRRADTTIRRQIGRAPTSIGIANTREWAAAGVAPGSAVERRHRFQTPSSAKSAPATLPEIPGGACRWRFRPPRVLTSGGGVRMFPSFAEWQSAIQSRRQYTCPAQRVTRRVEKYHCVGIALEQYDASGTSSLGDEPKRETIYG